MIGLPRYVLTLFPIYFVLARLGRNPEVHQALLTISTSLMGLFLVIYMPAGASEGSRNADSEQQVAPRMLTLRIVSKHGDCSLGVARHPYEPTRQPKGS